MKTVLATLAGCWLVVQCQGIPADLIPETSRVYDKRGADPESSFTYSTLITHPDGGYQETRVQVQDDEDALEYQRVRRIVAQLLSRFARPAAAAAATAYHTGASRLNDDSVFQVEEDQQQQQQQQHGYRYYYESPTPAANFKTQPFFKSNDMFNSNAKQLVLIPNGKYPTDRRQETDYESRLDNTKSVPGFSPDNPDFSAALEPNSVVDNAQNNDKTDESMENNQDPSSTTTSTTTQRPNRKNELVEDESHILTMTDSPQPTTDQQQFNTKNPIFDQTNNGGQLEDMDQEMTEYEIGQRSRVRQMHRQPVDLTRVSQPRRNGISSAQRQRANQEERTEYKFPDQMNAFRRRQPIAVHEYNLRVAPPSADRSRTSGLDHRHQMSYQNHHGGPQAEIHESGSLLWIFHLFRPDFESVWRRKRSAHSCYPERASSRDSCGSCGSHTLQVRRGDEGIYNSWRPPPPPQQATHHQDQQSICHDETNPGHVKRYEEKNQHSL